MRECYVKHHDIIAVNPAISLANYYGKWWKVFMTKRISRKLAQNYFGNGLLSLR